MAILTPLTLPQASTLTRAHGLGDALCVEGVLAGSVNSNFFIEVSGRWVFGRIYEEQEVEGVRYEWAVLDHLRAAGVLAPVRIEGTEPGEIRVEGKPTALFERIGGQESCQARVSASRAQKVGRALARCHLAGANFPWERESRFGHHEVEMRLARIEAAGRPELAELLPRLKKRLLRVAQAWPTTLPSGLIHGDLFRDNVRWEEDEIVGLLDWESASHGFYAFDLAVTLLAWCHGDVFDWTLAQELVSGYGAVRPLQEAEWAALRTLVIGAALRFTVTRITDFHLRPSGVSTKKDYRRFLERLAAFEAVSDEQLRAQVKRP